MSANFENGDEVYFNKRGLMPPMMVQYHSIKAQYQDCLLLYRMGDFYELFGEDAKIASKILDIVLTKRGKDGDEDIPMCGFQHTQWPSYVQKLVDAAYKVAICDQLETPEEARQRGANAVLRRGVVRVITAGTIVEENFLDSQNANYLASLVIAKNEIAIAWLDISTGDFFVESLLSEGSIMSELMRLQPRELIVSDKIFAAEFFKESMMYYDGCVTRRPNSIFDHTRALQKICAFYKTDFVEGFGCFGEIEIIAAGSLLEYIEYTQKDHLPILKYLQKVELAHFMQIDAATRLSLEIEKKLQKHQKSGTLLGVIDETMSAAGARLLSLYLSSPLINPEAINERLDNVQAFIQDPDAREKVRYLLKEARDMERALARVAAKRFTPYDLLLILEGLTTSLMVAQIVYSKKLSPNLTSLAQQTAGFDDLLSHLRSALLPRGFLTNDGTSNFIKPGYSPRLDHLYDIKRNSDSKIEALCDKYRRLSSVPNLKISKNNLIGYFIEITSMHASKMTHDVFIHRQSLSNGVRYVTEELKQIEIELSMCDSRIKEAEEEIFNDLRQKALDEADQIRITSHSIAAIDVAAALAHGAAENGYTRPIIDNSDVFVVSGGWHPVVAQKIGQTSFIANDCLINDQQSFLLITGPNMAGKSTFLRQNALICIMAQIGGFVPAQYARIGVVDKLFSRIGASDDISRGRSTFMIEMLETAYIMHNATSKSFVIVDEIGRGTSTYDGLSIAWSVAEALHDMRVRTLFATHYQELAAVVTAMKSGGIYTMQVEEYNERIVFMHRVIQGKADKSYGIHVAILAGMPKEIISRAKEILSNLEPTSKKTTNVH